MSTEREFHEAFHPVGSGQLGHLAGNIDPATKRRYFDEICQRAKIRDMITSTEDIDLSDLFHIAKICNKSRHVEFFRNLPGESGDAIVVFDGALTEQELQFIANLAYSDEKDHEGYDFEIHIDYR